MAGWMNRLRRPDWLGELQALLVLALVLTAVFGGIAVAAAVLGDTVTIDVPASRVSGVPEYDLREGAAIAPTQEVQVVVDGPDRSQRLAHALTFAPQVLAVAAVLALLLRLVRHARRVDPFTRTTVRQLRVLAVVAVGSGYLASLVESFARLHLSSLVVEDAAFASLEFRPAWLLAGFGLFAVAEVVNRGCGLRDELATVV